MAIMSLKQFRRSVRKAVEAVPGELLERLNGGFIVESSVKEEGGYLIMGEYIEDPGLGNIIILYYGSFREAMGGAPLEEWEEEILETVTHELRHHVESLAGVDDLSIEEERLLQEDNRP
ncbi:MAG TPA: metallopeptidase family protein [Synergistales bacterium]|nr:metallopeptidase family protein [Synergistales bacterium]HPC75909.1 metallopeptidase family protein [Synergistales bacterium]HRS48704.1 metallopeptidase family protein [Thermovirgaceae bacterium]HRU91076.1 metallopeptidase family protein [Thermovirgaceae bacterium]